jgi:hypothetical protein
MCIFHIHSLQWKLHVEDFFKFIVLLYHVLSASLYCKQVSGILSLAEIFYAHYGWFMLHWGGIGPTKLLVVELISCLCCCTLLTCVYSFKLQTPWPHNLLPWENSGSTFLDLLLFLTTANEVHKIFRRMFDFLLCYHSEYCSNFS